MKSFDSASITLNGIEIVQVKWPRKSQRLIFCEPLKGDFHESTKGDVYFSSSSKIITWSFSLSVFLVYKFIRERFLHPNQHWKQNIHKPRSCILWSFVWLPWGYALSKLHICLLCIQQHRTLLISMELIYVYWDSQCKDDIRQLPPHTVKPLWVPWQSQGFTQLINQ